MLTYKMKNIEYSMPEFPSEIVDDEERSRLRWLTQYSKNDSVRQHANFLIGGESQSESTYAGNVAMRYRATIQDTTRDFLWNIKEHGGMAPVSFMQAQVAEFKGVYSLIAANVAVMAMGKKQMFACDLSEAQLSSLVEEANQKNPDLLHEIKVLREAKQKEKSK